MYNDAAFGNARLDKFLTDVITDNLVYLFKYDNGKVFASDSNEYFEDETDSEGREVIPFWSSTYLKYGTYFTQGETSHTLQLRPFMEKWLKGMDKDGVVVGVNWDDEGVGAEILPKDLYLALRDKMTEMGREYSSFEMPS